MKPFKELGLQEDFLKVLEAMKFTEPTEIQEKVIPLAIQGKDIIGKSATGSGKTLAFGASIIQKLTPQIGLQALVLTPTRELCEQVRKALRDFSKYKGIQVVSIYGGVGINPQISELETADIVVGTPGRILDHMNRRTIDFSNIKYLVLDEADRMLDMGFREDVMRIVSAVPRYRQTFLFSATISGDIAEIAEKHMIEPIEISVESYVDPSKLHQFFYDVPQNEKFSLLVHLLRKETSKLVMVFCATKRNTDFIGKNLQKRGFDALALHGDLSQNQRSRVLNHFHKSEKFILVCTDVAARGLDIKNVSHVYNYDSPKTSEEYIHRVGRTARAGKEGKAITLIGDRDYDNFRNVTRDPSLIIDKLPLPEFEKIFIKAPERRSHGRGFGSSHSRGYSRGFDRSSWRGGGRKYGRRYGGNSGRFNTPRSFEGRSERRSEGRNSSSDSRRSRYSRNPRQQRHSRHKNFRHQSQSRASSNFGRRYR